MSQEDIPFSKSPTNWWLEIIYSMIFSVLALRFVIRTVVVSSWSKPDYKYLSPSSLRL